MRPNPNDGQFCLTLDETKPRGGRPRNPLVPKLMDKEGVSRATIYRRLKAKHEARLAKAAKTGIGRDHINAHPEGFHPTPPRPVRALLTVESFAGVVWECACGDGAISRVLESHGLTVISTDLVYRGHGRGGHDFLADHITLCDHVVTNPPYGRLATPFVEHALTRIRPGGTVCMLLPVRWEAAQSRRHLMALCCRKWVLSRRPEMHRDGYTGKRHSPQLDCAWYVFRCDHTGPTQTVVLPPDCGEVPSLLDLAR